MSSCSISAKYLIWLLLLFTISLSTRDGFRTTQKSVWSKSLLQKHLWQPQHFSELLRKDRWISVSHLTPSTLNSASLWQPQHFSELLRKDRWISVSHLNPSILNSTNLLNPSKTKLCKYHQTLAQSRAVFATCYLSRTPNLNLICLNLYKWELFI